MSVTASVSLRPAPNAGPALRATVTLLEAAALPRSDLTPVHLEHFFYYARTQGVRAMYLLTTTAESFFERRGYQRIARAAVVPAIQATREFQDLCPQSSALMTKAL